ncbi:MAG: SDR family oxidoreductase [Acidobacteriia bacterium]|jgi:glucose 1-dehydrogenase|nr:SDR family oxidoreductase [Terriglobia bacterium]
MKLKNKVAIVTGSSRGIGRATAIELARNGADIAVNALNHPDEGEEVVKEIKQLGRKAFLFQGSVANRSQNETMIQETLERLGRLDIMVANAAFSVRKPFLELEVEDVEKTWGVSLWGVFHCCQLAARQMVKQGGGNIAIVSSVHASRPFPLSTAYNGAKAAINHMAATWASELAQHKIRVNVLEPGWIDTPGERAYSSDEQIREHGEKLLMGRLGTSEEMAKAILFMVSEEDSSYMTGSCLRVDGGFVLPQP